MLLMLLLQVLLRPRRGSKENWCLLWRRRVWQQCMAQRAAACPKTSFPVTSAAICCIRASGGANWLLAVHNSCFCDCMQQQQALLWRPLEQQLSKPAHDLHAQAQPCHARQHLRLRLLLLLLLLLVLTGVTPCVQDTHGWCCVHSS
jgi:hypothetical protein